MTILKRIEKYNKWLTLNLLDLFLRNKQVKFPLDRSKIKKILLLRYDVLGDMIITIPMIDYLKANLPNAQIDILCTNRNQEIAKNIDGISNIYLYSRKPLFFRELYPLRNKKYDLIISLVFNKTTIAGLIANYINRSAIKVHLKDSSNDALYKKLFNILLPMEDIRFRITLLELQVRMIAMLFGLDFDKSKINKSALNIGTDIENTAKMMIDKYSKKVIIYNISAGVDYRQFSVQKNIEILSNIVGLFQNYVFFISFNPNDYEKAKAIVGDVGSNNCVLSLHTTNIMQVIALIKYCNYIITPDTSIVHIAAMFGKPSVIFYSRLGSLPDEWAPYGNSYIPIITKDRTSIEELDNHLIIEVISNLIKNN